MKTSSSPPRSSRVTRRGFLKSSSAASAAFLLGAPALLRGQGLNEKLNIAIIGAGGRGAANTESVSSENIVALCDVDEGRLENAGKKYPMARKYADFRKLFDNANGIDAVVVSTAEHTHAFATLPALQMGKHVYCEKPLTHGIWEARIIAEAAKQAKVATQMGTQIHATENYHRVVELIQTGAIGPVREAHVWVSRAWGLQTPEEAKTHGDIVSVQDRPKEATPVPAGLHWDLFVGPAPERPFHEVYWPGPKWYRWWDFGSGTMSDLGSHFIDLPFWALKLRHPLTIEAKGPPPHPELAPASMSATYEYGARGGMPPVKLTWYQGTEKPPHYLEKKIPQWGSAILFVGDKGMLLSDYGKHLLLPEADFKDFKRPDPFIPRSSGHHAQWIEACKTGKPTGSNFDYAGALTEANHLGNVAYRIGKKIEWDPVNLKARNAPEADRLIRKEYRKGWQLLRSV
ncbi:MAG: Gfo/Idh/MocA family oxidoreductase [Verrucomicrobia bacterium]|nr:Gfo/Idh/MocA family oxidoreductase [Verrucomicrobiota bacterium]